jgi:ferric-dicitrate binding protein FerR (iron transport regulator)
MIWKAADAYRKSQEAPVEEALARFKKARTAAVTSVELAPTTTVKSLPSRRYFLRVTAAAAVLFGAFFFFSEMGGNQANGFGEVYTMSGQREETGLSDGSVVYVNGDSEFEYPTTFDENSRAVKLKGEAFFEIVEDASKPFTIATNQLDVKVLGTSFNVYAYPDKTIEEVSVATGKVVVSIKQNKEEYILVAGDHLSYDHKNGKVTITKDLKQNAQAWRTGVLTFDSVPLTTVFQTLEKHFDLSISLANKELSNCPFTVPAFKNANQEVVLETIKTVFGMELKKTGSNRFEFVGGNCQ